MCSLYTYSCSPPAPRPSPPKYCGLRLAVSNTPAVMNTPAINSACMMALIPKATMLPRYMLNMMHHIHASTCIIMCRVFMSGMLRNGLCLLSMISLYKLVILFLLTLYLIVTHITYQLVCIQQPFYRYVHHIFAMLTGMFSHLHSLLFWV